MATGRDAAAVAITTSFGTANLVTVVPWGAFLATCSWFNRAIFLSACSGIFYEAFHLALFHSGPEALSCQNIKLEIV
jgi:hypothetical protein